MTITDQNLHWLALATVPGIGAIRYHALVRRFGSPEAVLKASERELLKLPDIGAKLARAISSQADYQEAERQLRTLRDSKASFVTMSDADYPLALKQIYDPPPFLFVRGALPAAAEVAVAIVGSRSCTRYGLQAAEKIAHDLAAAGLIIVSGLARGIDSAAHRGALRAAGRTIGVLGCGLDVVYPPENEALYGEVAGSGALVTEFLFGAKPDKHNFPSRNRIISGLCRGVLLVEAGRSSGALLTAKHALDQDREVLALPGNINSAASYGTNELIKQGAIPVTTTADVLLALGLDPRSPAPSVPVRQVQVPEPERRLLDLLTDQPQQADRLSESLGQPIATVLTLLLSLEMAGLVKQLPGKLFVKES